MRTWRSTAAVAAPATASASKAGRIAAEPAAPETSIEVSAQYGGLPVMGTQAEKITRPVLPPIIVDRNDTTATGGVGAQFYFAHLEDPAHTKISTDHPDVLQVIPGYKAPNDGEFTCGAHALQLGSAHIKIVPSPEDPNQKPVDVDITITR
ncbi:hypothetical protein ACL02U_27265 [Streptomyces sp. MS06]|uniref:hypothetical protein n=1 Tax=Streptomyces sp. MS06 TaxID=3385974 RepID=UPI0039A3588D